MCGFCRSGMGLWPSRKSWVVVDRDVVGCRMPSMRAVLESWQKAAGLRPGRWCTGSTRSGGLLRHRDGARMDERPPADLRSVEASKEISTMTAPDSWPLHALAEDNLAW